jgi:hypothetical protein
MLLEETVTSTQMFGVVMVLLGALLTLFGKRLGGSVLAQKWNDFFTNATVYGLDIMNSVKDDFFSKYFLDNKRIKLNTSTDAYNELFFNENFLNKNIKFDFLLDDGPHTLDTMKKFVQLYSQVMKEDGILVIEDVQNIEWFEELSNVCPSDLKKYINNYE